jgi:hypothetical protein
MSKLTGKPSPAFDRNMRALRLVDQYLQEDVVTAWRAIMHHYARVDAETRKLVKELLPTGSPIAPARAVSTFACLFSVPSAIARAKADEDKSVALLAELESSVAAYLADPLTRERVEHVVRACALHSKQP